MQGRNVPKVREICCIVLDAEVYELVLYILNLSIYRYYTVLREEKWD